MLTDIEEYLCMGDRLISKGIFSSLRYLFKFWEMNDNISETAQNRDIVAWKTNKNHNYMAYRMVPLQVTLSDSEGHICCLKL